MTKLKLTPLLEETCTEEEVKSNFASYFRIKPEMRNDIDLYTPQVFFEFKFDKNLQIPSVRAKCFAQAMYYARNPISDELSATIPTSAVKSASAKLPVTP